MEWYETGVGVFRDDWGLVAQTLVPDSFYKVVFFSEEGRL